MKRALAALLALGLLAGCNTFEGFVRDVSAGTRAVDRAL